MKFKKLADVRNFYVESSIYKESRKDLLAAFQKLKMYKKKYSKFLDDMAGFLDWLDYQEIYEEEMYNILTVLDLGVVWGKEHLEENLKKYDIYNIDGEEFFVVNPQNEEIMNHFEISNQGFDRVFDGDTGEKLKGEDEEYITLKNIPD